MSPRTEIVYDYTEFSIEDMIAEEDVVITISHSGFIKRTAASTYRRQGRGGKGVAGTSNRDDDFIEHMFIASTHHYILFFTNKGKCYWLKVHEVPEAGRTARGRSIINLIQKDKDEYISAFITVKEFDDDHSIIMATRNGTVKKTSLSAYGNPRSTGIIAINLVEGDELIEAAVTDGNNHVFLASRSGQAIRFSEADVRDMGRNSTGVRGIKLEDDDYVIGMVVSRAQGAVLVVSEGGYGKRADIADFRVIKRGGKGVIAMNVTEKTGKVMAMREVTEQDDIVIITARGMVIRQHVRDIRIMGRNTQGVRLINLNNGDHIADISRLAEEEDEEEFTKPAES